MQNKTLELHPSELMEVVGKKMSDQKILLPADLMESSPADAATYFPYLITKTLKNAQRFTLFGLAVKEMHVLLDEENRAVAFFIVLPNEDLLNRMASGIGNEYLASGVSVGSEPVPESHYYWDYKKGCISLELKANKLQFKPKLVTDEGLVIFNNCNPLSYITVGENH